MRIHDAVSIDRQQDAEASNPSSTISIESATDSAPDFNIGYPVALQMKELVSRAVWCRNTGMALPDITKQCSVWNLNNSPPMSDEAIVRSCEELEHDRAQLLATDADIAVEKLNKCYAWITSNSEIFRLLHGDFIKPHKFHLEHSNELVETEVGGKLKIVTASEAWLRSRYRRRQSGIVYTPGKPQIINGNVNLWQGWGCNPIAGDIEPWRTLLDYVFEGDIKHRDWFERWVAYPIQKPGIKLNTAIVMWSARQGVGKTLIGQTIGRIYGSKNYKEITANELRSQFTGWTKSCQFILGEENSNSRRLSDSDRLKHLITGETIEVNEKFQPLVKIQNCINFLFTSNHANAFFIEAFDRRYFVWEIQGLPLSTSFYADFVDWRDHKGGIEALMDHFCQLDLSGFDPKDHAPMTMAKAAMIECGRTELEHWLAELREEPIHTISTLGSEVISLEKLVEIYNRQKKSRVSPLEAGNALQRLGRCEKRRIQIGLGKRYWFHAISRVEHWATLANPAWLDEARKTRVLS